MTIEVELKISNVYVEGGTIETTWAGEIPEPPAEPEDAYDEWADDELLTKTGTGRTKGDAMYFVVIAKSSRPDLLPVGKEFEW